MPIHHPDHTIAYLEWYPHLKKEAYSGYLAILRAPRIQQPLLAAFLMFYHTVQDIAYTSSEPMIAAIRIAWWREACTELMQEKNAKPHPILLTLAPVLLKKPQLHSMLIAIIEASDYALDTQLLLHSQDFYRYIDSTAGSLYHAWAEVLMEHPATQMQKTAIMHVSRASTILRFLLLIPQWAYQKNMPFSAQDLARHHLAHAVESLQDSAAHLSAFCEEMHADARGMLFEARTHIASLPAPLRVIYRQALYDATLLKAAGFNPYDMRLRHPHILRRVFSAMCA